MVKIGPSFADELDAAGLKGAPVSWLADGTITGRENLTAAQDEALSSIVAAHDPTRPAKAEGRLANEAAIRFTVGAGTVTVAPNCLNLSLVTRVSIGRYRAYFVKAAATIDYIAMPPSVMDPLVRTARVTAKAATYVEIRVVDQLGVAADAQEVGIIIQRIVWI